MTSTLNRTPDFNRAKSAMGDVASAGSRNISEETGEDKNSCKDANGGQDNMHRWMVETKLAWAAHGQRDARLGSTDARSEQPDPQTGAALPKRSATGKREGLASPDSGLQPVKGYRMELEVVGRTADQVQVVEVNVSNESDSGDDVEEVIEETAETT
ncbi:hypothetical protein B0H16DRAFT_1481036 [Mycena metata]|uniref:Uncharacterized protein n=1 Tax=Mycena metata TaxID=1033252 RepID=A0AAD7MBD1_9AGAR|nr:hypothetical protein B0H16DRAFT_1481036 [Mycena metata]